MEYRDIQEYLATHKDQMSASERMRAYNAGELVDYQPYTLQAPEPAMADIFGYTTKQFATDFEVTKDIIRRRRDELGLDSYNIALGLKGMGAALGSKLSVPEHGIDHVADHILKSYDDLDSLHIPDPYTNPVLSGVLNQAAKIKEAFPDISITTSVAGPLTTAIAIRPVELVLRDTRKNPEKLHQLLQLTVDSSLKWFEVFCKEFGQAPTSFSDPVTSLDVISKKQFDEFSLPYLKQLIQRTKEIMGSVPGAHICGHSKGIWKDLADAGLGFFSIDNIESLQEAKAMVGDRMRLAGNVPPIEVIQRGTIDEVIASARECMAAAADSPAGYILNTGCQLPIGTPKENIEAFLFAAKFYGRGARKGCLPEGLNDTWK